MTEQIDELEAFKDGVIHLVQKYFGRKPRKAKKNGKTRWPGLAGQEETISD